MKLGVLILAGLCAACAPAMAETYVLSASGADLGRVRARDVTGGLAVAVDTEKRNIMSVHAVARFQSNAPRQRTAEGFWIPWNEAPESLIDLHLVPADDGTLRIPLVEEDLSDQFLPIIFTVIVRTADETRWGYLVVEQ